MGRTMSIVVLSAICCSILASPALSVPALSLLEEAVPYIIPSLPECLIALKSVQSCMEEVTVMVLNGQLKVLGPQCCKAFSDFDNKCWPKVLPVDPLFPPSIQNFCHSRFKN